MGAGGTVKGTQMKQLGGRLGQDAPAHALCGRSAGWRLAEPLSLSRESGSLDFHMEVPNFNCDSYF